MNNSALLRLFFVSIGIPLTLASSASSSSSSSPSSSSNTGWYHISAPPSLSWPTERSTQHFDLEEELSEEQSKLAEAHMIILSRFNIKVQQEDDWTYSIPQSLQFERPTRMSAPRPRESTVLSDTTIGAGAVQLETPSAQTPSSQEGRLTLRARREQRIDSLSKKFEAFLSSKKYEEAADVGESMTKDEVVKHLCPLMADMEHYKKLSWYLKQRKVVPGFLAYGDISLVGKAILEVEDSSRYYIRSEEIHDAIAIALKENLPIRGIELSQIARTRSPADEKPHEREEQSSVNGRRIMSIFERDDISSGRFINFHGKDLRPKYPSIEDVMKAHLRKMAKELRLNLPDDF